MTLLRHTIRRQVELVAVVMDVYGLDGLKVAATISTPKVGMTRRVFDCGPTPGGLVAALRGVADWIEADYVAVEKVA